MHRLLLAQALRAWGREEEAVTMAGEGLQQPDVWARDRELRARLRDFLQAED